MRTPPQAPTLAILRLIAAAALPIVPFLGSVCMAPQSLAATSDKPVAFDIPAGDANASLKEFSGQSGEEILYLAEDVAGVTTNRVKATLGALDALNRMLAGTPLFATRDQPNGPLAVARRTNSSARSRVDPPERVSGDPAPSDVNSEVVKMEAYNVTTSLGRYAEGTSSMATKVPTDTKLLSSSLQIFNSSAIGDRKAQKLEDIYPYVIGMARVNTSSSGFSIRGFNNIGNLQPNVEIDGLQGGTSSRGSISTADVERIEILKGPNSVLYGFMNPGGVVNIVTKRPQPVAATALFATAASYAGFTSPLGTDMSYTASVDNTGPIDAGKHLLYRIVAEVKDEDSFRKRVINKSVYLYPSFTYRLDQDTTATVLFDVTREKRNSDDGLVVPFNNVYAVARYDTVYQEPTDIDRDFGEAVSTSLQHIFANRWTLRSSTRSVWHADTRHDFAVQSVTGATPITNSAVVRRFSHNANGHRYNYGDINLYGDLGPDHFKSTILFGAAGGIEWTDFNRVGFGNPPPLAANAPPINLYNPALGVVQYPADGGLLNDRKTRYHNYGLYISDRTKIGDRLYVTAGVRRDHYDSTSYEVFARIRHHQWFWKTLPQFGLVYQVIEPLSVYASYSQSFKPNSVDSVDATGHANFPPEGGDQKETGLKFESPDRKVVSTLAFYDIRKKNVLTNTGLTLPDGTGIFRVDGGQESKGVELEVEWLPVPYWQVQAGAACMNAKVTASSNPIVQGTQLANAPRNSGNFWSRYNIPNGPLKGLGFGLGVIYQGARHGGDPSSNLYFKMAGYTRVDTGIYYEWRRCDFALNVANILDRQFIVSAPTNNITVYPGDPRKITLSARLTF